MIRVAVVATLLAAGTLAAGCSGSSHSGPVASAHTGATQSTRGGETSCKDFLSSDKAGKESIIETYLRSTGQSTDRSSTTTTRLSAEAFCRTSGKNKLVRDITTG
ncbi:hypothetical protein [Nocardia sp. BMG111209]|uniref:hypothetical protein n=1 Tax=Nocardia sp. BMG111209 TaxID=1160137 RepID=UPI00037A5D2D|nr:hypothetical protein [Nocardia sp. BMG111209]